MNYGLGKIAISALAAFMLSACGGGGGSDGGGNPTPPPTPPTPPSNSAPSIVLGVSAVTLDEGQETTVSVTISDPDGDDFTVELDSSVSWITYSNNQIVVDAPQVSSDTTVTVSLTATDSENASTTRNLNVTVNDVPVSTVAPNVSWVGFESEPDFVVRERTELRLPFEIVDPDSTEFDYNVSFSLVEGQGSSDVDMQVSIDEETNELVVNPQSLPSIFAVAFRGTFSVSDSTGEDSETFLIEIVPNSVSLNISLRSVLIVEGESKEIPFTITANDIDLFEFTEIDYVNEQDALDDPLDFSIDKNARVFNISAESGFAGRTVNLRIRYQENDTAQFSRVFPVTIRGSITANEIALQNKLDGYLELVNQTNDYEFIARYALDILYARGDVTKSEYQYLIDENNDIRAVNVAFAKLTYNNVLDNLTNSTIYTDAAQYQSAVDNLDSWLNNVRIFRSNNVPFTNDILDQLGWENLGSEESVDIGDGTLSRFVGNTLYGEYQNGNWVFDDQYQYLEAPLGLLTNIEF